MQAIVDRPDSTNTLPHIHVPVLVISGNRDRGRIYINTITYNSDIFRLIGAPVQTAGIPMSEKLPYGKLAVVDSGKQ